MTCKQIDQSREIRLWIGTICGLVVAVSSISPEVRYKIGRKYSETKAKIRSKFKKGNTKKNPYKMDIHEVQLRKDSPIVVKGFRYD